jgi:hypothetical protein
MVIEYINEFITPLIFYKPAESDEITYSKEQWRHNRSQLYLKPPVLQKYLKIKATRLSLA